MKKRGWLFPALVVGVNAIMILLLWSSLSENLPAHFDLAGNASGSISRTTLLFYPLVGAVIGLTAYWIRCRIDKEFFNGGLLILTSGIELIILSSTMVTLTQGTKPFFMLAEPVILVIALSFFIAGLVKSKRKK
ncbi:MAG: DUF1648 domain-containing protein [Bacteroidales bacterium]|nr:DUF1648 domain-containing protein [Bacteroidales bacterium]